MVSSDWVWTRKWRKWDVDVRFMYDFIKGLTMEVRDGVNSGITLVGSDAPSDYHVAPRTENPSSIGGSTAPQGSVPPPQTAAMGVAPAASTMPVKKKRGRPRKYGPDGSVTMALSPTPLSSSAPPPIIDFSAGKRGKVRPASSVSKAKFEVENLGNGKYLNMFLFSRGDCSFCWNQPYSSERVHWGCGTSDWMPLLSWKAK